MGDIIISLKEKRHKRSRFEHKTNFRDNEAKRIWGGWSLAATCGAESREVCGSQCEAWHGHLYLWRRNGALDGFFASADSWADNRHIPRCDVDCVLVLSRVSGQPSKLRVRLRRGPTTTRCLTHRVSAVQSRPLVHFVLNSLGCSRAGRECQIFVSVQWSAHLASPPSSLSLRRR